MTFQKNDIIDYYDDSRLSCALVLDVDDRRLHILNDQGKETNISVNRVLIGGQVADFPINASKNEQTNRLRELCSQRDGTKEKIDLKELWEIVRPETLKISLQDLSELLFGSHDSLDSKAALIRAIVENRLYFKIRLQQIEVVPPEKVEQEQIRRRKEIERNEFLSRCSEYLSKLKNGKNIDIFEAPAGLKILLEEAALLGTDWLTNKKVKEIFTRAQLVPVWDPFKVLVRLGVWSEDENIRLRAGQIPTEFSDVALEQARLAASKSLDDCPRELFEHNVITIDSSSTLDIDDAISISFSGDRTIIGIHITEAAFFVDMNTELDKEIRDRAVSIYMADLVLPMMPKILSEEAASLIKGEFRPCISAIAIFDRDFRMTGYRIARSLVKVTDRLSYEETDQRIIDANSIEAQMYTVARSLREKRVASGALIFKDPELTIKVSDDRSIDVAVRERETSSQILVSELMILANNLFASNLRDKCIPCIYRSQPPPLEKIDLGLSYDPVLSYRCKKALARGSLSLYPEPHSTLGLNVYTTATSPLRRYTDLLIQRQLQASIDERCRMIDADTLDRLLTEVSYKLDRASLVERERHRYYLLKYMEQRKDDEFEVTVLQRFPRFYLVMIESLGFNSVLHTPMGTTLNPYDRALAKVEKVNPREDRLTFSLVRVLPRI
ncbi:MAG: RNB domain-containing ribonuclease [Deltaproteobacteria bacterium]|nr:RNB domain-containing ribonuclease [Deltaproteobacteria bacterium]